MQGDEAARRRVRILTPLIKFRACRDARTRRPATRWKCAAASATPRNGPTRAWCATRTWARSGKARRNIVALDVLRAIRREHCLEALLPGAERAHRARAAPARGRGSPRRWTRRPSSRTRPPARRTKRTRGRRRPASTTPAPRRCSPTKARAWANGAMRAASCSPSSPTCTASRRAIRCAASPPASRPSSRTPCCLKHRLRRTRSSVS